MSPSAPHFSHFLCHRNDILYRLNAADCVWRYNNSQTLFLSELLTFLPPWSTLPAQLQQRSVLTVSDWISVNNSCAVQPWRFKYRPQYNGIFRYSSLYVIFVCNYGVFSLHWALMGLLNSPIPVERSVYVVTLQRPDFWGRLFEYHWRHRYSSVVFVAGWVV